MVIKLGMAKGLSALLWFPLPAGISAHPAQHLGLRCLYQVKIVDANKILTS